MSKVFEIRYGIAQIIATVATICSAIGWGFFLLVSIDPDLSITPIVLEIAPIVIFVGFGVGAVSYLFGGLGTAIKMTLHVATVGLLIVPFPFNFASLMITVPVAGIALICLPIIPVRRAYLKKLMDRSLRDF